MEKCRLDEPLKPVPVKPKLEAWSFGCGRLRLEHCCRVAMSFNGDTLIKSLVDINPNVNIDHESKRVSTTPKLLPQENPRAQFKIII